MSALQKPLSLLIVFFLLSCGHPPRPSLKATDSSKTPVALLIEKEISGVILGKPLRRPFGLAVDARGVVYVSDAGNSRVIRFNADLTPDRDIGGYGAQEGLFDRPSFLAVDHDLSLLVSDEGNRRICRYNSQLQFVEALAFYSHEDPLKFGYPSGVALTEYGEVWTADREKNRLVVFDNVGAFDRFIGDFGYSGGQLLSPEKIVRDGKGNFIVCDAGNGRLVVYDEYGNFSHEISNNGPEYPTAAVVDDRHLWLLDGATGTIHYFDGRGRRVFEAGPNLAGSAQPLKEPSDMAMLIDGRVMISDSGNNRLLVCRAIYDNQ